MITNARHFDSKKFTMTFLVLSATFILAMVDKLTPVVGSIFTGLCVIYPVAQAHVDGKKEDNG